MSERMTIGALRDALATVKDKSAPVRFRPMGLWWRGFGSWRGVYAEPAVGFTSELRAAPRTVEQVLAEIDLVLRGASFGGWKGGEHSYGPNDIIHVDNPGEYTPYVYIVGVKDDGYTAWLLVEHVDSDD